MKKKWIIALPLLSWFIFVTACGPKAKTEPEEASAKPIRVLVFDGNGAAQTCVWEAEAAARLNPKHEVRIVGSQDLAQGALDAADVLVIPGGSGSREYLNLGTGNHERIRSFLQKGGGLVGICAGAYLTSNTPEYSCLSLSGAQAIDIEHDNRGRGVAMVQLNDTGKKWFPELAALDTLYLMYYEGPVVVPAKDANPYTNLGTMLSDVHVEGDAPSNMTNNKPFFYLSTVGEGKIFSSVGHPEATPGMQWIICRAIDMVKKGATPETLYRFGSGVVQPNKFRREILMTKERREKESGIFKTLLYGSDDEKIAGMLWLRDNLSWDGKRWLQGLLYDASAPVRKCAAQCIAWNLYGYFLHDVQAALQVETDPDVKQALEDARDKLSVYNYE